jgi:putative heme-binding domain-containing protein
LLDRTRQLTDEALFVLVSEGRQEQGMPAFDASLSRGEILALVGHIRTLQGVGGDPAIGDNAGAAEPEPSPEFIRGERLFYGKARCAECHAVLLEGGRTGPNLTKIEKRRSREQIDRAITDPSARIVKGYEVMEIVTRDGETLRGWARTGATPEGSVQLYYPPESLWTTYFYEDLESRRVVPESLMPAGLLDDLTEQEVGDLMEYLLSPKRVTLK